MIRGANLVAATSSMMMRNAWIEIRGNFIPIAIEMLYVLLRHRDAIAPLGRMRRRSSPRHEDEKKCADKGRPAGH